MNTHRLNWNNFLLALKRRVIIFLVVVFIVLMVVFLIPLFLGKPNPKTAVENFTFFIIFMPCLILIVGFIAYYMSRRERRLIFQNYNIETDLESITFNKTLCIHFNEIIKVRKNFDGITIHDKYGRSISILKYIAGYNDIINLINKSKSNEDLKA